MEPERLSASELSPDAPFRLYRSILTEPYPLHWHDFYELALINQGEGVHLVNGQRLSLAPGTLFLLSPVDFHRLEPLPGQSLDLDNIIFGGELLDDELRQWLFSGQDSYHFVLPEGALGRVRQAFITIRDENSGQGVGHDRLMRSALERILLEVARQAGGISLSEADVNPAVHHALLYLNHHFRSMLKLEDVAGQAGLTPTYFTRVFHRVTGMQFQKYLQNLRLRFAAALLLASDLPVTEICFASGFGSMAHFGRAFHARFGLAPGQYRHHHAPSIP